MYFKIDKKNRVILQIADKFAEDLEHDNVTTFRTETEPTVADDEALYFNPKTKAFYTEKVEATEEQKEKAETFKNAREQKEKALKWLTDNDWKINKRALGEWEETDERWLAYLADRAKARADYDSAEAALAALEAPSETEKK